MDRDANCFTVITIWNVSQEPSVVGGAPKKPALLNRRCGAITWTRVSFTLPPANSTNLLQSLSLLLHAKWAGKCADEKRLKGGLQCRQIIEKPSPSGQGQWLRAISKTDMILPQVKGFQSVWFWNQFRSVVNEWSQCTHLNTLEYQSMVGNYFSTKTCNAHRQEAISKIQDAT